MNRIATTSLFSALLLAPSLSLLVGSAAAQTVYRCGNTYAQKSCPDARIVETDDSRTAAQRADARRAAADESRLAAEMRRDRLADEHALHPATAGSLSGAYPPTAPPYATVVTLHPKKRRVTAKSTGPKTEVVVLGTVAGGRR